MKFGVAFGVFSIVLITNGAEGRLSFDSILELISPREPDLHRVRRIEDAQGDPLAVLDTVGLVERYGYPAEQHNLTSDDGYNIVFFRMPGSPSSPPAEGKPMIFLQHGMLGSSDTWVLMGPDTDLAFMLVDAGYDVWMGNIRGNSYGRSHTNLTTGDKEFWNFSFHEAAIMDVSKMINYALEHSGQKKLFYIGHSMGTTMSYVLLTQRPEFNEKMRLVVSLAPTAYWKHNSNFVYELVVQNRDLIKTVLMDTLEIYDIGAQSKNNARLAQMFCTDRSPMQSICLTVLSLLVGQPIDRLNTSLISYFTSYFPAGASLKTLYHFSQCLNSGDLQQFDNGPVMNLKMYGTEKPPIYDMSKISAPVALIYSRTDSLSIPPNVIGLSKLLPNLATCEEVPAPIFNHLDFIVSKYAKDLLYNRILELFSLYSK